MIRNLILIVTSAALVVTVCHLLFDSGRGQAPFPPESLPEVPPRELRLASNAQQTQGQATPTQTTPPTPSPVDPEQALVLTLSGNGVDELRVQVVNSAPDPVPLTMEVGDVFQGATNRVMLVEPVNAPIRPGETRQFTLQTIPLRFTNQASSSPYRPVNDPPSVLNPLVDAVTRGTVRDFESLRVAAQLLVENPSLATIAAFPALDQEAQARSNVPAKARVTAARLINALLLLESIGVDTQSLDIANNPQLQLESLVNRATNPNARRYYKLEDERKHWDYWSTLLTEGNPRLRHYALYGIARFFPDIALDMMPRWASNRRLTPIYRLSAVYALAGTERPEALPRLEQLSRRYPEQTNMGRAIRAAISYLKSKI